jgi:hypothetical protein
MDSTSLGKAGGWLMKRIIGNPSEGRGFAKIGAALLGIILLMFLTPADVDGMSYGNVKYSDATMDSYGIIRGWGVTDANSAGCYCHTAKVTTTITSPQGRTQTASDIYGGRGHEYARADVSLGFLSTDVGNYTVSSTHWAYCPYCHCYFVNAAVTSTVFKIGAQQVQFYWDTFQDPPYGCYYANNCEPAPAGSYCGPAFFTTALNKGTPPYCYIFDSRRYIFFKAGGSLLWWKSPGTDDNYYSDSLWAYPCDGAIP